MLGPGEGRIRLLGRSRESGNQDRVLGYGLAVSQRRHDLFGPWYGGCAHAQLRDAEAYEFGDHLWFAGRFAADAYGDFRLVRGLAGLPDQSQHGGMVSALQPHQALVAPVSGEGVLDEIVRAYGEESRFFG